MGIPTILVIDPEGPKYRFASGRLEPLKSTTFDILSANTSGQAVRFDLDEIEKLLD